jgi:hypothetical protein
MFTSHTDSIALTCVEVNLIDIGFLSGAWLALAILSAIAFRADGNE